MYLSKIKKMLEEVNSIYPEDSNEYRAHGILRSMYEDVLLHNNEKVAKHVYLVFIDRVS